MPNANFPSEDLLVIKSSLKLFMENEILGVPSGVKFDRNMCASECLKHLEIGSGLLNGSDLQIMHMALTYFEILITEAPDKFSSHADSQKYLSSISRSKKKISRLFEQMTGHELRDV